MSTTPWHQNIRLPQLVLLALCLLLLLAVVAAGVSTAEPFATYNTDWTGTTDLRNAALADENTTVVVDNAATGSSVSTATTTALVLGVPNETAAVETTAANVLAEGGTVVITDEVPATTNTLLETLGATARVERGPVRDPQSYHRQPILPVVTTTNATGGLADTELTLNYAGTITPSEATVLATTSQFAYVDKNRNERFDAAESLAARPVVTREAVGNGTVILVSDSSVFINAMYDRDGNRAFAEWIYADTNTLILTGSAVRPLPRLVRLLLWAKSIPASQAIVLAVGASMLLLASQTRYRTAVLTRLQRDGVVDASQTVTDHGRSDKTTEPQYESGLMSVLRTEHPEWDQDTLRRLVTAIITRRRQTGDATEDTEVPDE